MNSFEGNWITETWTDPRGVPEGTAFSMKVKEVLYDEWTGLQKLWIGLTEDFGRVMFLDGYVMLTERDEFVYHEMLAHVPLCSHPKPRDVLIIGGGDGGTLREVLRHRDVERALLCEIDGEVVEASRRFLPAVHDGAFDDPRSEIKIGDGCQYVRECVDEAFDVILIDSTDPVGPGEILFSSEFYADCRRILRPGGLISLQSEGPFKDPDLFRDIQGRVKLAFGNNHPYLSFIPTYPTGMWTLTLAYRDPEKSFFSEERSKEVSPGCRYYTPEIHKAAFHLPNFVQKLLP